MCSSESDSDICWNYQYAPRPSASHSIPHWDLIGCKFVDTETGEEFEIDDVCVSTDNPDEGYFFRYSPSVSSLDGETHHTPCEEILNSSWAVFSDAGRKIISTFRNLTNKKCAIAAGSIVLNIISHSVYRRRRWNACSRM